MDLTEIGAPGSKADTFATLNEVKKELKSIREEKSGSILSGAGMSDIALAMLLMRSKNPKLSEKEIQKLATTLVGNKSNFLQELVDQKLITKAEMDKALAGTAQTVSLATPQATSKISKLKSFAVKAAPYAVGAASAAGSYYGTGKAIDALKDKTRGYNVASPSVIKMKAGSMENFNEAMKKLFSLSKKIAGISKSLDKDLGFAIESLNDLQTQLGNMEKSK